MEIFQVSNQSKFEMIQKDLKSLQNLKIVSELSICFVKRVFCLFLVFFCLPYTVWRTWFHCVVSVRTQDQYGQHCWMITFHLLDAHPILLAFWCCETACPSYPLTSGSSSFRPDSWPLSKHSPSHEPFELRGRLNLSNECPCSLGFPNRWEGPWQGTDKPESVCSHALWTTEVLLSLPVTCPV